MKSIAFHPGFIKSNLTQNALWLLKVIATFMQLWGKDDCEIGVYLAAAKEVEKANGVGASHFLFSEQRLIH
ncbi:hypothetical protein [Nostoc sp.]|uniref:hypothetical protein n=1 Tax=Nostoc sp. TaxID=1180 RepID=UPI002FFA17ED